MLKSKSLNYKSLKPGTMLLNIWETSPSQRATMLVVGIFTYQVRTVSIFKIWLLRSNDLVVHERISIDGVKHIVKNDFKNYYVYECVE